MERRQIVLIEEALTRSVIGAFYEERMASR